MLTAEESLMKSNQPTIIISGANGFLGKELVAHFSRKNFHVVGLVRNPEIQKPLKNVTYKKHDLSKKLDDVLFKNADYFVHAAYIKEDKTTPNAFALNLSGTKQLVKASRKYNLKHTIFISSMSAQPDALSTYGKQKYEIEKLFSHKNDVVIRSGLIIGAGGLVQQITNFIRKFHIAPLIGGGTQPLQIIAVYDLVKAIETLLSSKISGTLTIAEPTVFTYKEFYRAIAANLHMSLVLLPVPFFIPLFAIQFAKAIGIPLSITKDNLLGIRRLRSVDTKADLAKINLKPDRLEKVLRKVRLN